MSKKEIENNTQYWKSLEQWREDPEFQAVAEKEFLSSPLSESATKEDTSKSSVARRDFLKLMGASMALTSFGCVRRPAQKIVPFVQRPPEITPGEANYYASSLITSGEALGTVVTTREGRPIKIEGNTLHPANRGGMSARAHAHVLNLYDPDRLSGPKKNLLNDTRTNRDTISTTYAKADKEIVQQLKKGKVALLTSSLGSPATRQLVGQFKRKFKTRHYQWDAINYGALAKSQEISYGRAVVPRYRVDRADFIVSVDTDFLGTYLSPTEFTRDFSNGRKQIDGKMNRLVAFESILSLTGTNADQRFQIRSSQAYSLVMSLLAELVLGQKRGSVPSSLKEKLRNYLNYDSTLKLQQGTIASVAKELWNNRGRALVFAGGLSVPNQQAVLVATNWLHHILDADGKTVDYKTPYTHWQSTDAHWDQLLRAINSGLVKTLIVHGVNPIYSHPNSEEFKKALKKVDAVIYTGDRNDETGLFSHYVLPDHHDLENWGDAEIIKGVYSIQQPTIQPLGKTRAFQESLLSWMGSKTAWHDYLKKFWQRSIYKKVGGFENFWIKTLQDGVYDTTTAARKRTAPARRIASRSARLLSTQQVRTGEYELVLYPTVGLHDGTLANVSWLQEFPDPVTKICWDNYVSVSPQTARKLKLKEGNILELKVGVRQLEVPVHIQPGTQSNTFAIALGYGRTAVGRVGNGVGVRAVTLAEDHTRAGLNVLSYRDTGLSIPLANVQGHHSMEGRQIVVEATLDQYKQNPEANIHRHKILTLWNKHKYEGHKWGMSVDLNACTGCGSCIIACQSENNIPTVGKKYVLQGREMHWMRVDRYFVGNPEDPDTVQQPVMCMHCDNAPCETVCPMLATVHSDEGTNDMIYNRCVGTRYCANNCPYKVRRFNWFEYSEKETPLNMALNPEVTVRQRGVMEKCTFCNHRIQESRHKARIEKRELKDGDVKTACEQSCPAQAIVFGDMNDSNSKVSQAKTEARTYSLLEELNNGTAVTYKTKIRNTAKLKSPPKHKGEH